MGFRLKGKPEIRALRNSDEARALALKLKGLGGTECERELKAKHLHYLRTEFLAGHFLPFRWRTAKIASLGLERRIDGQHSTEALLSLTPEEWSAVRFPLYAIMEEYECDEVLDLPLLFEKIDRSWSTRDPGDIMGVHLGIHKNLTNAIENRLAIKLTKAVCWYRVSVLEEKLSKNARHQIIHEAEDGLHDFLVWCGSFLHVRRAKELMFPGALAALYHTTQGADDDIRQWWKDIAPGKNALSPNTFKYQLAAFLEACENSQTVWPKSISKDFGKANRPNDLVIFGTCLRAFYSWTNGYEDGKKEWDLLDIYFTPKKGLTPKSIVAQLSRLPKKAAG